MGMIATTPVAPISPGEDITWKVQGACNEVDGNIFFPAYDAPSSTAAAKIVCARCPVRRLCLDWALKYDEVGVWGGTSEAERRALKRKRTRSTCMECDSEMIIADGRAKTETCLSCGLSWLT